MEAAIMGLTGVPDGAGAGVAHAETRASFGEDGREEKRPPNVIVIVSDDNGSVDLGCYGASDLHTPHLDGLAARGVRFTQFYSAAPVCSASRAGILTGRAPMRTGLLGNSSSERNLPGGLPARETTLAQLFKHAGYTTACIGKWHLGYTPETMPSARGFDVQFGHMGGCIDSWSHFFYWSGPNVHDLYRDGKEIYAAGKLFADLIVNEAEKFVSANRDRPFFLYFAPNMPHYPLQPDPAWLRRFRDLPLPRRLYAGWMAMMDERVGALLAHLDRLGLREDTIVIYQSDHGHSTEERAFWGGGSAGPYRGAKFSLYEGGIRMPAIISWPSHLPEGAVRAQMAWGCDWLPTLLELCGLPPAGHTIDGKSIAAILHPAESPGPHETLIWAWADWNRPQWAVRHGEWKLLGRPWDTTKSNETKPEEGTRLYNLAQDIGEQTDLSAQHPHIASDLQARYDAWIAAIMQSRQD
jgi:arylsulfatase A-like enzyme